LTNSALKSQDLSENFKQGSTGCLRSEFDEAFESRCYEIRMIYDAEKKKSFIEFFQVQKMFLLVRRFKHRREYTNEEGFITTKFIISSVCDTAYPGRSLPTFRRIFEFSVIINQAISRTFLLFLFD
jgi:hypothetical protein